MNPQSKIYVAGHKGMVGSAIVRELKKQGYNNIIGKSHSELDLANQSMTEDFFSNEKPDYVFIAAAMVGGINANMTKPADFLMNNLAIQCNIIGSAYKSKVKKLLFLGSSCIYPKLCPQPIKEEYLLSGYLEPTNEAYAIAKIAGLKMCEYYNAQYGTDFISCMPTNLYGQNDNFDLESSHVLPALIRKIHEAKTGNADCVEIWGTGKPLREFLYVDDMAAACIFLMQNYSGSETVNIGTGQEVTIKELAETVKDIVGFNGGLVFNPAKPDGTPRKLLDTSKLRALGWTHKVDLRDGIKQTYKWYLANEERDVL